MLSGGLAENVFINNGLRNVIESFTPAGGGPVLFTRYYVALHMPQPTGLKFKMLSR